METFEPLINLLVLMSALSVTAERLANALKLRDPDLRVRKTGAREEKQRERRTAQRAVAASILLALLLDVLHGVRDVIKGEARGES